MRMKLFALIKIN